VLLSVVTAFGSPCAWAQAAGTPGCGLAAPASGTYTLVHAGVTRSYGLAMPSAYDPHRPARLVLAFHGWGGDTTEFLGDATVVKESGRRGYVLVAPRGLGSGAPDRSNNSWTFRGSDTGVVRKGSRSTPVSDVSITPDYSYPSCRKQRARNTCSWTQCQDDDVGFVQALVGHLEDTLCIDARQVFASGGSLGASRRLLERQTRARIQHGLSRRRLSQLLQRDRPRVAPCARLPRADGSRL
jgi:poly(3-hydroxybutyrate) depolymerase